MPPEHMGCGSTLSANPSGLAQSSHTHTYTVASGLRGRTAVAEKPSAKSPNAHDGLPTSASPCRWAWRGLPSRRTPTPLLRTSTRVRSRNMHKKWPHPAASTAPCRASGSPGPSSAVGPQHVRRRGPSFLPVRFLAEQGSHIHIPRNKNCKSATWETCSTTTCAPCIRHNIECAIERKRLWKTCERRPRLGSLDERSADLPCLREASPPPPHRKRRYCRSLKHDNTMAHKLRDTALHFRASLSFKKAQQSSRRGDLNVPQVVRSGQLLSASGTNQHKHNLQDGKHPTRSAMRHAKKHNCAATHAKQT